jgi:hypothetical protein
VDFSTWIGNTEPGAVATGSFLISHFSFSICHFSSALVANVISSALVPKCPTNIGHFNRVEQMTNGKWKMRNGKCGGGKPPFPT